MILLDLRLRLMANNSKSHSKNRIHRVDGRPKSAVQQQLKHVRVKERDEREEIGKIRKREEIISVDKRKAWVYQYIIEGVLLDEMEKFEEREN